ncbi:hypothetical protein [Leuconostoc fallax]|uniref:Uncharacterized protein n=1 Tax=Leuconostoc fallax TaxID=1251 RepID=A0A4R5N763_9LACO|nr:hypothetical protein [Leuconostoc fallax]MBU7455356.1 hypothetical protein [Leuconostoc fallax]TDG67533.1 hypothetical protein C5L23_001332 [Leuconostoc fallax]
MINAIWSGVIFMFGLVVFLALAALCIRLKGRNMQVGHPRHKQLQYDKYRLLIPMKFVPSGKADINNLAVICNPCYTLKAKGEQRY